MPTPSGSARKRRQSSASLGPLLRRPFGCYLPRLVDRQKLDQVLKHWKKVKAQVASEGVSFSEAMRLLAGASYGDSETESLPKDSKQWSTVIAGDWLAKILTITTTVQDSRLLLSNMIISKMHQNKLKYYIIFDYI